MASKQMLAAFAAVVVAILPTISVAVNYVVGDESGWKLKENYTAWAEGKEFKIGDALVFAYPPGAHNVIEVTGDDFRACSVPLTAPVMSSGNDTIPLTDAGKKWFLCGKGNGKHCEEGMKLVITVNPNINMQPGAAPPPSSPPASSSAKSTRVYGYRALTMMMMMIIVVVATAVVIEV